MIDQCDCQCGFKNMEMRKKNLSQYTHDTTNNSSKIHEQKQLFNGYHKVLEAEIKWFILLYNSTITISIHSQVVTRTFFVCILMESQAYNRQKRRLCCPSQWVFLLEHLTCLPEQASHGHSACPSIWLHNLLFIAWVA